MRVILFDIDGTLIRSSGGSQAIYAALEGTLGRPFPEEKWPMGGKTDRLIFREMAERMGVTGSTFQKSIPEIDRCYLRELEARLDMKKVELHPGVLDLMGALEKNGAILTLLTGNHPEGARMKLTRVGIWERFSFGVYGDQTEDRNELPGMALRLAKKKTGQALTMKNMVVIGDTPRDIACARAGPCRVLAVATGGSSYEDLELAKPDLLVRDLTDPRCLGFLVQP